MKGPRAVLLLFACASTLVLALSSCSSSGGGYLDETPDPALSASAPSDFPDLSDESDDIEVPDDTDVPTDFPTEDFADEDPVESDEDPIDDQATSEKVTFRITGKGRALQVTYYDGQISQDTDVKLPWKKTITVDAGTSTAGFNVNAQRSGGGSGSISCSIEHDGVETAHNKSKGPYSVVSCLDEGS